MKKIILSFDYELFFGSLSGTIVKSIIEPTYRLLDSMDRTGLKGNFFVDFLMIKKLKETQDTFCQKDLCELEKQLCDIVRRGHRIELHLHSHWFDAIYLGEGLWDFSNFSRYSLSAFSEIEIQNMFLEGVSYLNSIGSNIIPNYHVCAFRAGGWAIQPFSKIKKAFEISNIKLDSSVAYKICGKQENSEYDFLAAPSKEIYKYNDDVCLECKSGKFIEVPIYSIQRNLFDKVLDKLIRIITPYFNQYSDGTHLRQIVKTDNQTISVKTSSRSMFSVSFLNTLSLLLHLIFAKKRRIVCIIDHPKDINPIALFNIRVLGSLFRSVLYKDLL